jgi:hypothetical protein
MEVQQVVVRDGNLKSSATVALGGLVRVKPSVRFAVTDQWQEQG